MLLMLRGAEGEAGARLCHSARKTPFAFEPENIGPGKAPGNLQMEGGGVFQHWAAFPALRG